MKGSVVHKFCYFAANYFHCSDLPSIASASFLAPSLEAPADLIGLPDVNLQLLCKGPHRGRVFQELSADKDDVQTLID